MPFYDHRCRKCGNEFVEIYPISRDPDEIKCPECAGNSERLISAAHIGWDRKMLKTFTGAEDERAAAQASSHMGSNPYDVMPGED